MRVSINLFSIIILIVFGLGQTVDVETAWVQHYGSGHFPTQDVAQDIVIDSAGNAYVSGWSTGVNGRSYTLKYSPEGYEVWALDHKSDFACTAINEGGYVYEAGSSKDSSGIYFLQTSKYSTDKTLVWTKNYGASDTANFYCNDVITDSEGNTIVLARDYLYSGILTKAANLFDDPPPDSVNVTIVKYSPDGDLVWAKYHDSFCSWASSLKGTFQLAVDEQGDIYAAGGDGILKSNSQGSDVWKVQCSDFDDYDDELVDLELDENSNVILTGSTPSSANTSRWEYTTVKYTSNGDKSWVTRYGDSSALYNYWAKDLQIDAFGNIYLTGYGNGDDSWDYVTIKYNPDGSESWVSRYHQDGDQASSLSLDTNGNVYVSGNVATLKYNPDGSEAWVVSNVDMDGTAIIVDSSGSLLVAGERNKDLVTQKYSADGHLTWVVEYGSPNSSKDRVSDMTIDATGSVYQTGSSYTGTFYSDFLTVKYNPDGSPAWVSRHNGSNSDYPNAIDVDVHGNVYVAGYSDNEDNSHDFVTIKVASDGTELWKARYDGPTHSHDEARNLKVDDLGNVYVTGSSYSSNSSDYTTIKYSPSGEILWNKRYDHSGRIDSPSDLELDSLGNVYVTGYCYRSNYPCVAVTIKYSSTGSREWVSVYSDSLYGYYIQDMAIDNTGNVYITGGINDQCVTIKYNPDGSEAWIARVSGLAESLNGETNSVDVDRHGNVYVTSDINGNCATIAYNSQGVQRWINSYENARPKMLTLDGAGNIYTLGETGRIPDGYQSSPTEFVTLKYLPNGSFAWKTKFSKFDAPLNVPATITVDEKGSVYVSGTSGYLGLYGWKEAQFTTIKYLQPNYPVFTEDTTIPVFFNLKQNYPNPFNPSTRISFSIPEQSFIRLAVFDIQGKEVAMLDESTRPAGYYEANWNGQDKSGKLVSTGVYFCRLDAGANTKTIKMLLLR